MKSSKAAHNQTPETEVYRDFMRLDPARRRRVAVRMLRNQKILADLHDQLLIQRSLDKRGENVPWECYKRGNGSKP
jgi:hypothetical protein